MFQISLLDLTNMDVLEEQLIGVDVAYFGILIRALRGQQENDPDFKITPEYFNAIIDKVFAQAEEQDVKPFDEKQSVMKHSECKEGQSVIIDNTEGTGFKEGFIVPNQPGQILKVRAEEPDQPLNIQVLLTGLKGRSPKAWFKPENLRLKQVEENKFIQGYVCAISTIASIIGEHTNVKEALYAGIGNRTCKELISLGVDKMDIETLKMEGYLSE